MVNPKTRSDNSDSNPRTRRKGLSTENPVGRRIVEALGGRDLKWLSVETGIPDSTLSGYIANGIASAEKAVLIATALDRSVEWLITGRDRSTGGIMVDAGSADWIEVPEYNLRDVTDESLGDAVRVAPIRRDWLNRTLHTATDLWLAQLLSTYQPAGLEEGSLVICRTISRAELAEGYLCLWRVHGSIAIGRFSIQPEVALGQGVIGGLPDARIAAGMIGSVRDRAMSFGFPDVTVSPSQIGEEEGHYHLVGRIMGSFIRPL